MIYSPDKKSACHSRRDINREVGSCDKTVWIMNLRHLIFVTSSNIDENTTFSVVDTPSFREGAVLAAKNEETSNVLVAMVPCH
jgi:hypothetical protein